MELAPYLRTILLYVLAGLAEIGGGWLVWQWLREGRTALVGLLRGLILVTYGVIPTLQAEPAFGRVYAAYGGIFIVLSILWGRVVDGWRPDRFDLLGGSHRPAGRGHHHLGETLVLDAARRLAVRDEPPCSPSDHGDFSPGGPAPGQTAPVPRDWAGPAFPCPARGRSPRFSH
jgi:small multidrug resistance family-3 protein